MRRMLLALLVAAAMLLPVLPAAAHTATLEDFARNCSDDGKVRVKRVHRYIGGSATLDRTCTVVMESGARLVFRDVSLTVKTRLFIIGTDSPTWKVKVIDSAINAFQKLYVAPSPDPDDVPAAGVSAAGVFEPGVVVKRSTLSSSVVTLEGSAIVVRDSKLTGDVSGVKLSAPSIIVSGSTIRSPEISAWEADPGVKIIDTTLTGLVTVRGPEIRVIDTTVNAADNWVGLYTGRQGRLVVKRTTIDAAADVNIVAYERPALRRGEVRVVDSSVTTDSDVFIQTGRRGFTVAKRNTFRAAGVVTISTGPLGVCKSVDNTPSIPCS